MCLLSYITYHTAFAADRKNTIDITHMPASSQYDEYHNQIMEHINEVISLSFEEITIDSYDGLKLYGKYYHRSDSSPLAILFHGYRSASAERDFCGGMKLCRDKGFNVLLVDERAQGKSEGRAITFGIKERYDCLSWAEYASKHFGEDKPIFLVGVSMGAATVAMASNLRLPKNVVGIAADSAYSSPSEIIKSVIKQRHLPYHITYFLAKLGAKLYGGFDLEECSSTEALKSSKVPVLFIHGEADDFVPCYMSRENYEACSSEKRLITVPNAVHGMSYFLDMEKYSQVFDEFIEKCINRN
jgi:pimeloyl-ACP methyl ester carboxylesterase